MSKSRQFWTLLKFQTTSNPFLWFMPLALGTPLLFSGIFSASYHSNLASLLNIQNLFFVGLIAMWTIVPEMAGARSTCWSPGTEFILTRAIDRPILYRARAALLFLLAFLMPTAALLNSFRDPNLKVTEYSEIARQQCLAHVPNSNLEPDPSGSKAPLLAITGGKILVEDFHFWMFALVAIAVQVLLLAIHPLKYRLYIFYAFFLGFVCLPIFQLHHFRDGTPSETELVFFYFAAHQTLFWIATACLLVLGQLWCEQRFASLEQ